MPRKASSLIIRKMDACVSIYLALETKKATLQIVTDNYSLPRFKNLTGRSTHFARRYSATFFPRKSTVVVAPTPRSRRFRNKKCTPRRFGSSNRSICSLGLDRCSSPRSSCAFGMESSERNQRYSSLWRTQNPQFASGPLSPDQPWTIHPRGPRVVGPKSRSRLAGDSVIACEG